MSLFHCSWRVFLLLGYLLSSLPSHYGWVMTRSPPTFSSSSTQLGAASRREWLQAICLTTSSLASCMAVVSSDPLKANAMTETSNLLAADAVAPLEMKPFVDALFTVSVPKPFFTLRRTQKGDLPDAKTGKGRRGSSIFTAGNMAKAEVVAVERYPVSVLLEENGIEATGDLTTFPALGEPAAVANLIVVRRDKDSPQTGSRKIENVQVSPDGKEMTFRLRTEIEVQKPELLLEQYGVSELFRITVAKASLKSEDGNLMAIFASALEQDFNNGVDGPALEDTVKSFQALPQPLASPA